MLKHGPAGQKQKTDIDIKAIKVNPPLDYIMKSIMTINYHVEILSSSIMCVCVCHPCLCSYLVALDQDALHLFEQVLQVPAAQSLNDLHQRSPRHVTDLLETVPQQHAHFDQDTG